MRILNIICSYGDYGDDDDDIYFVKTFKHASRVHSLDFRDILSSGLKLVCACKRHFDTKGV